MRPIRRPRRQRASGLRPAALKRLLFLEKPVRSARASRGESSRPREPGRAVDRAAQAAFGSQDKGSFAALDSELRVRGPCAESLCRAPSLRQQDGRTCLREQSSSGGVRWTHTGDPSLTNPRCRRHHKSTTRKAAEPIVPGPLVSSAASSARKYGRVGYGAYGTSEG
jgi:hypothetical protein